MGHCQAILPPAWTPAESDPLPSLALQALLPCPSCNNMPGKGSPHPGSSLCPPHRPLLHAVEGPVAPCITAPGPCALPIFLTLSETGFSAPLPDASSFFGPQAPAHPPTGWVIPFPSLTHLPANSDSSLCYRCSLVGPIPLCPTDSHPQWLL